MAEVATHPAPAASASGRERGLFYTLCHSVSSVHEAYRRQNCDVYTQKGPFGVTRVAHAARVSGQNSMQSR